MPNRDTKLALTLWQPWCSAIIRGPKRLENRPWAPGTKQDVLGNWIWLHAGLTYDYAASADIRDRWKAQQVPEGDCPTGRHSNLMWGTLFSSHLHWPMGAILGRARVVGWIEDRVTEQVATSDGPAVTLVNRKADEIGAGREPWWSGPFGWVLDDVQELPEPVPCTGHQKLWNLKKEVHEACISQELIKRP